MICFNQDSIFICYDIRREHCC